MNIGIVLGVSEYLDANNNLPGCQKDADIIKSILDKTSKYDDILYINEKLTSAQVKEKLTDFISNHKQSEIEEFIFYYTGHGEFHNDEFYFHLSDFTEEKRNQTSLQNGEIDNLIKTLKPILVVKIIDACQSGKSYIKEANVINKYFKKTQIGFDKCYFLNSSLNDQYSYQSDLISDFTQSFINAVKEHKTSEIRYKDIIDYISDEFERNSSQTPFFVIQADYTEIFCQIDKSLRAYLDSLIFKQKSVSEMQSEGSSLLEKIKEQAKNFSSKDEALQLVNDLQAEVQKFECNEQLKEIFDLNIAFHENYNHVVKETLIGK